MNPVVPSSHSSSGQDPQLLRATLDLAPTGLALLDETGAIAYSNAAFHEIFGWSGTELFGQHFSVLARPEEREYLAQLYVQVIRGHALRPMEIRLLRRARPEDSEYPGGPGISDSDQFHEIWVRVATNPLREGERRMCVVSIANITEQKQLESGLQALATTDPLTSIPNRRHFFELAHRELARARRTNRYPTVVMIDLDRFKQINDARGHAVGDQVLIEFALACQSMLRETDIFARLGGEEFAIVLPETSLEDGALIAERVRATLEPLNVPTSHGPVYFSASLGVAQVEAGEETVEPALHRADIALYEAKNAGRNRVAVYSAASRDHFPSLHSRAG